MSEWKNYVLYNIVDIIGGGTPKRAIKKYWNGNIPWLSVGDFNNDNRLVFSTQEFITEEGLVNSSTKLLETGQIVISARGTVGALAQVAKPMAFNQSCYGLNAKKEHAINDFLYYLLKEKVSNLQKITHGAVFDTITRDTFKHIEVKLPPLPIQKKIAHILSTLDEKIELNRKMNETLENMAQAIFKSWFVDFEPVKAKAKCKSEADLAAAAKELGISKEVLALFPSEFEESELGMIPKGWEVKTLNDIVDFQNGYSFKSRELHDDIQNGVKVFKMGHIERGGGFKENGKDSYFIIKDMQKMQKYLLKKGDVLMAMTDMKANMALLAHTALMPYDNVYLLNQRVGRLRLKEDVSVGFSHLYLFTNYPETIVDLRNRSNSGVQVNLTTKAILETKILLASDDVLKAFDVIARTMFEQIFTNGQAIKALQKTRDTLLPKLLSGELDVSKLDLEAGL